MSVPVARFKEVDADSISSSGSSASEDLQQEASSRVPTQTTTDTVSDVTATTPASVVETDEKSAPEQEANQQEEEEEIDEDAPRYPPSLPSSLSSESLPEGDGDETESAADLREKRKTIDEVLKDVEEDVASTPEDPSAIRQQRGETTAASADEDGPGEHFDSLDTLSSSMGSSSRREHLYKILVIGELGTGKTSIIRRYVHQFFSQHYRATIGVDFALKVLHWDQNTLIRLQLWDIAGQERFGNMTRVYYKEAVGCFIVFDVSRSATFEAVMKWKNDVDSKLQLPDGSPVPCVLLANKCDLQKEGLVCDGVKMDEFCKEKGFIGWFETSAKENIGVDEAAQFLVSKILANDIWSNLEPDSPDRIALEPSASGNKAPNKCNC